MFLLPLFLITQTLQYLDKTALNYAKVFGMEKAMGMSGSQFSMGAAIFYMSVTLWPGARGMLTGTVGTCSLSLDGLIYSVVSTLVEFLVDPPSFGAFWSWSWLPARTIPTYSSPGSSSVSLRLLSPLDFHS
jgi:hypothetical protein